MKNGFILLKNEQFGMRSLLLSQNLKIEKRKRASQRRYLNLGRF
jgi:hypothetical protein